VPNTSHDKGNPFSLIPPEGFQDGLLLSRVNFIFINVEECHAGPNETD
jgi:hypothetical protein